MQRRGNCTTRAALLGELAGAGAGALAAKAVERELDAATGDADSEVEWVLLRPSLIPGGAEVPPLVPGSADLCVLCDPSAAPAAVLAEALAELALCRKAGTCLVATGQFAQGPIADLESALFGAAWQVLGRAQEAAGYTLVCTYPGPDGGGDAADGTAAAAAAAGPGESDEDNPLGLPPLPSYYDWREVFPELKVLLDNIDVIRAEALGARAALGTEAWKPWPENHFREGE